MTDTQMLGAWLVPRVVDVLRGEAVRASPEEACGILVGRREGGRVWVTGAIPCRNEEETEKRRNRFLIDPKRVIEEERSLRGSGREIVGFYHSHPVGEPVPSGVDRGFMELWPDVVWVIVGGGNEEGRSIRGWSWNEQAPEQPREIPLEIN